MTNVLIIIGAFLFVVLTVYGIWVNSPAFKGREGENKVHNILMQLPDDYYVFKDVILNTKKGTTQIDHIVVSKYGVFAIETKNYRGEIYGDDNRKYWTQVIVTEVTYSRKWYKTYTYVKKSRLYNPVKQSLAHAYAIKNYLKDWRYLPIVPVVVFCGDAVLSNVESSIPVVYDYNLLDLIRSYTTSYLTDTELKDVVTRLEVRNVREVVDDREHLKNLRAAAREENNKIASGICPKCGGTLVARNGKYGKFYGCSNYPKCKYTIS